MIRRILTALFLGLFLLDPVWSQENTGPLGVQPNPNNLIPPGAKTRIADLEASLTQRVGQVQKGEEPVSAEDECKLVIADLVTQPPESRPFLRYLSLQGVFPEERLDTAILTSVAVNRLSWGPRLVLPELVPGSNNKILRLNMLNYVRSTAIPEGAEDLQNWYNAWEKLSSFDPYYREPWISKDVMNELTLNTNSVGALLRADFFYTYTILDDDEKTTDFTEGFYSQFLGLPKDEEAFFSKLRINRKDIINFGTDRAGIVVQSGTDSDGLQVAKNNRIPNRLPTILTPAGGYLWFTQDFINSRGKRNAINNPLTTDKDGGEYLWSLPNGLQGEYLTQKVEEGGKVVFKQINEVPMSVARDTVHIDAVRIGSCTACHVRGINKFRDVLTKDVLSTAAPGGVARPVTEAAEFFRLNQLYQNDLDSLIITDQDNYVKAVRGITGLEPEQYLALFRKGVEQYQKPVTPERAAWEFGTTDLEKFLADKNVQTTQGSLILLLKGKAVNRDTFEDEYKNGMMLQNIKDAIQPKGQGLTVKLIVPGIAAATQVTTAAAEEPGAKLPWESYTALINTATKWEVRRDKDVWTPSPQVLLDWLKAGNVRAKDDIRNEKNQTWVKVGSIFVGLP